MSQSKTIFEKHPKLMTFILSLIILAIFLSLVTFILNLRILQDSKDGEKYSVYDKLTYAIRCHNERNIKLRETPPNRVTKMFADPNYKTLEQKEYVLRTNNDGFIEPAFIHKNPDLTIFFIGGSTTECLTVDEEFRFPYLSGRLLEEKTGLKVNSENGAKSGNNSIHSINILVNKILPYKPDMVVMMHNINDLSTLIYEGTYWNKNKSKSNLVCAYKNSKDLKRDEWSDSTWQNKVLNSKEEQDELIKKFENNLKLFVYIARSQNIIPVLMTQPNRIEDNPDAIKSRGEKFGKIYQNLYKDFNQKIRDFGKEQGILVIDLAKTVPSKEDYIYDEVHINKEGSIIAANKIAQDLSNYIVKNNLNFKKF